MSPAFTAGGERFEVEVQRGDGGFTVTVGDHELEITNAELRDGLLILDTAEKRIRLHVATDAEGKVWVASDSRDSVIEEAKSEAAAARAAGAGLTAPMPGKILELKVAEGDAVEQGDTLLVLEAMKMENDISAPTDGTVAKLPFAEGEQVERGDLLAEIEEDGA